MKVSEVNVSNKKTCTKKHAESLKQGYLGMSRINCQLAEEGLSSDNDALCIAEHNLRSVNDCDS